MTSTDGLRSFRASLAASLRAHAGAGLLAGNLVLAASAATVLAAVLAPLSAFPLFLAAVPVAAANAAILIRMRRRHEEALTRLADARASTDDGLDRRNIAMEFAGMGVWEWDPVNDKVQFSRQWKQMLGLRDEEIADSPTEWIMRIHPDDRAAWHDLRKAHLSGESPSHDSIHRMRHKEGSYLWVRDRGIVVDWTEDGKPARMIGIQQDISVDRRIHDAETMACTAASQAAEASPAGLIVYRADGSCLFANPAAAAKLGMRQADLLEGNLHLLPLWRSLGLLDAALGVLRDGRGRNFPGVEVAHPDSKARIDFEFLPQRNPEETCLVVTLLDMSERHAAMQLLQEMANATAAAPAVSVAPAAPAAPAAGPRVRRGSAPNEELLRLAAPLSGKRLLLVEDNRLNQIVVKSFLEKLGCAVAVAADGREALRLVDGTLFDGVLMDLHMPEMDGLEATRRLRAEPRHARLPIVALTASAMDRDRDACLAAGMNDWVPKPFDPQRLVVALLQSICKEESEGRKGTDT